MAAGWIYYQVLKWAGKYSFEYLDKPSETWEEIYERWEKQNS